MSSIWSRNWQVRRVIACSQVLYALLHVMCMLWIAREGMLSTIKGAGFTTQEAGNCKDICILGTRVCTLTSSALEVARATLHF